MVSITMLMLISNPQMSNYVLSLCRTMNSINIKKYNSNMLLVIFTLSAILS